MHKSTEMSRMLWRGGLAIFLIMATTASLPFVAAAATYYASPDGTGTGTEASPCSITDGISKVRYNSDTLILKSGRYLLEGAIAFNGTTSGDPTIVRGETGDPKDVILDAQGQSEVMRLNRNVLVSGITMMNGSNKRVYNGVPDIGCYEFFLPPGLMLILK